MIAKVENDFDECKHETLNNVFLSLQACMEASLGVGGNNNYKFPHMAKARLMHQGNLPVSITCNLNHVMAGQQLLDIAAAKEEEAQSTTTA